MASASAVTAFNGEDFLLSITRKAEWPDWVPPPEMIERLAIVPRFMAGGRSDPLSAPARCI